MAIDTVSREFTVEKEDVYPHHYNSHTIQCTNVNINITGPATGVNCILGTRYLSRVISLHLNTTFAL